MKGKISDLERLRHIRDAINTILDFTKDIDYQAYISDYKLCLAITKLIEIIGEASNSISDELKSEYPEVEWKTMNAVRNILVHAYFGIDYNIMWQTIQNDIVPLKGKIDTMISKKENV